MKFFHVSALVTIVIITALITVGCDEGMDIAKPVIDEMMVEDKPVVHEPIIDKDEPFTFFIHGDGTSDKLASEWVQEKPSQNERDFIGCVFVPKLEPKTTGGTRPYAQPINDVTLTIASGPRSGESVITNQNGQYIFLDVEEDELHLRVEKEHFEAKEVIVHRSRPTALPGGIVPNYQGDPQRNPGNVLIGQEWPEEVRFILQQTLVVYDLLYIEVALNGKAAGVYESGVVIVDSKATIERVGIHSGREITLDTFAHEIFHAHQNATVSIDGSESTNKWIDTPEGKAFAEARRKDWEEYGKSDYYDTAPGLSFLRENAAEICSYYWSASWWEYKRGDLETSAPNRLRWAEEWFGGGI